MIKSRRLHGVVLSLLVAVCGFGTTFAQSNIITINDALELYEQTYIKIALSSSSKIDVLLNAVDLDRITTDSAIFSVTRKQLNMIDSMGIAYSHVPLPRPSDAELMAPANELLTNWNFYPTRQQYDSIMDDFALKFPTLCTSQTLHTLASGRKITILRLTSSQQTDGMKPLFLYSSSIHGDETVGYILLLRLADHLLKGYGTDQEATWLLDNMEIWICPLANPDGTYYGGDHTVSGARRGNSANVDLNRNYRDPRVGHNPDYKQYQPETVTFMNFADTMQFTMGANLHGGAELINYPWDTWMKAHPDQLWWEKICRRYADTVHAVAPKSFFSDEDNGVTNGAAWYVITGGRQDYMNYFVHCRELTIELSYQKLMPASQLDNMWNYHNRALINFMKEGWYGIRGVVTDSITGKPLKAEIKLNSHDFDSSHIWSDEKTGFFSRPVLDGKYVLTANAQGYEPKSFTLQAIPDDTVSIRIKLAPLGQLIKKPVAPLLDISYSNTSGELNINGLQGKGYKLFITSVDGRVGYNGKGFKSKIPLGLPKGIWVVTVELDGATPITKKIVVF